MPTPKSTHVLTRGLCYDCNQVVIEAILLTNAHSSSTATGDVMSALANKQAHIPFRNSKLTQLLQDSLCGQAKAMMFVHIAPEVSCYTYC